MSYHRSDRIVCFFPSFLPFRLFFHLMMILVRTIDGLFLGLQVEGREHLEGLGRGIVVSNHTLLMDPAVIAHALRPRRTYFTMLEETSTIPFLGTFVRLLGGIPIPRSRAALRTLERSLREALSALGFVHFFPEGECYRWNQAVRPFRPGAFVLALRLKVPVVPVAIVLRERRLWGCRSVRLLGRRLYLPPRVVVVISPPVFPPPGPEAGSGARLRAAASALSRSVRAQVQSAIDQRGGSRSLYRGPMPRIVRTVESDPVVNNPTAAR
jgi:1-acyl-sn-glycerol-3-phosphate acyltransferase